MWITALLVCSIIIFKTCAQDVNFDSETVTDNPKINQDVDWDQQSARPAVTLNIESGRNGLVHDSQKEISELPLVYSNQWRPFLMPIQFSPYMDRNLFDAERDDSSNRKFIPTFIHRSSSSDSSERNFTAPQIPYQNSVDQAIHRYSIENSYSPPQPSRAVQSQFSSVPLPISPPVIYPNALSINVRRSFTAKTNNGQNSSDTLQGDLASDPVTSSYEERYTQVLPSPVFPNMPFIPQQSFPTFPYGSYRNLRGYYPPTVPLIVPPSRIPTPTVSRETAVPLNTESRYWHEYDREAGSEIEDVTSAIEERPVYEQPRDIEDQSFENTQRRVPNFVQRNSFPLPLGIQNFGVWPPAIFPPLVPRMASRVPTLRPPFLPEIPVLPTGNSVVSEPVPADDLLPLPPNPDNLPPASENSSAEDLSESVIPEEKPNTSRIPYEFGFDMNDGKGTDQHRKEVSDSAGVVRGSYGYRDMFGVYRLVNYIADKNGFRAVIKSNEPGVASSGSANVVVMADHPPPDVAAEGVIASEPGAVVVPEEEVPDLIAEGTETETE